MVVLYSGKYNNHIFPVQKKNFGDHKFKDFHKVPTAMTFISYTYAYK